MSGIDLSQYQTPDALDEIAFDDVLSDLKGIMLDLFEDDPSAAAAKGEPSRAEIAALLEIEGQIATKVLQAAAYHALQARARVNDRVLATMLPFSSGADLDALAANFGVIRKDGESDTDLRNRTFIAPDAFTVAGPIRAYEFHALSASARVKQVSISQPIAGTVRVTVLETLQDQGDTGAPQQATLDAVTAALNDEDVRPLCDLVEVVGAAIVNYALTVEIYTLPGADVALALSAAESAAAAFVDDQHALGRDVTLSALTHALHQPGVTHRVEITSPAATIAIDDQSAPFCTGITITHGGTDE